MSALSQAALIAFCVVAGLAMSPFGIPLVMFLIYGRP